MIVFISGNVPALKSSKTAVPDKGVFMSKSCRQYLQKLGVKNYGKDWVEDYKTRPNKFRAIFADQELPIKTPVMCGFHFVRGSRHKFDWSNAVQIIEDLLVAHQVIPDDNMDHFIPFSMAYQEKWYSYDKDRPGVWLKFTHGIEPVKLSIFEAVF